MKKLKYVLIIFVLLLAGCKRNSFTRTDFTSIAEYNGYLIREDKSGYESYPNIKDIYYAINREYAYDIQFIETDSIEYAKKFILVNVDEIKENITDNDYVKSNSLSNYEFYHAENESTYYIVIRSDKNIIYIEAPINYINQIEEFLEDLSIEY